mmetsp:Transcript_14054/g.30676  ORF Transcript_14054/g.30676 Transcript_14054/m.30676 type:complete len:94 (-) Transcript_14054:109-390(-)
MGRKKMDYFDRLIEQIEEDLEWGAKQLEGDVERYFGGKKRRHRRPLSQLATQKTETVTTAKAKDGSSIKTITTVVTMADGSQEISETKEVTSY